MAKKAKSARRAKKLPKRRTAKSRRPSKPFSFRIEVEVDNRSGETLAVYIRLSKGKVAKTIEHTETVYIDVNARGQVLGVELLEPASVSIEVMQKVAKEYDAPPLAAIDPKVLAA